MAKLYLYIAAGVFALGCIIGAYQLLKSHFETNARLEQDKANAVFAVKAKQGRVDYNTCDLAGGVYQFAKGTCKLP